MTADGGRSANDSSPQDIREALSISGWRGFALVRRYQHNKPEQRRALARQLRGISWESREDFDRRQVRFGFVSSGSTANLEHAILLESLARGIVPVQYHAGSPASRELRDIGSGLHLHDPDIVVVAISPGLPSDERDPSWPDRFVRSLVEDLRAFRAQSHATLLVHGFVPPEFRPLGLGDWRDVHGQAETYAHLNLALAEQLRDVPDAYIVDVSHVLALSGASWWTLDRSTFVANVAIPEGLGWPLARYYAATGAALRGFARKCLVLDLDDTLWGGEVGEAGADRIQLGSKYPGNVFRAIQRLIRQLHDGGVLLAINSRNNEADAWEPFLRHPEMALERRHFSGWRINWQDKVTNLVELGRELGLSLDSFVMLDNDPVQQAWIEQELPEVHVILDQDPMDMLRTLATQHLFESFGRTKEDGLRAGSYHAAVRRSDAETMAEDRQAFLAGLGLTVTVGRASSDKFSRLAQLSQRTSQFNLTSRRYTESHLREMMRSSDVEILWCSVRDCFADDGITGLAILRGPGDEWELDTFLLSCRVLGKGVELAFAATMCRVASERGVRRLLGEYVPTPRNAPAADFFRAAGFSKVRNDGERRLWVLTLSEPFAPKPPWISLCLEVCEG